MCKFCETIYPVEDTSDIAFQRGKYKDFREDNYIYADVDGSLHCYEKYNGEYEHEDHYHFTDKPTGDKQDGGEYCEQYQDGEDSWHGKYYYPTAKGKYFMFEFWI